ncbi:MAG: hypothetical protein J6P61_06495 [Erysipelotrichaceae bacterium]|nr:hypothetical protein [Erysipelotrichaceae bacterium]
MKKKLLLIVLLCALTAVIALIHMNSRPKVAENSIEIISGDATTNISLDDISLIDVKGTIVNGKGETKDINAKGCLLSSLLNQAKVTVTDSVKVVSSDEYSATITADELKGDAVYLIQNEDSYQLLVFTDQNSKRNVKDVERIEVQ